MPILEQDDSDNDVECIFLGTGTSSSLPHIECLTAPPNERRCKTCLSTLNPEGKKNIRRNTSLVLRMNDRFGSKKCATFFCHLSWLIGLLTMLMLRQNHRN